MKPIHKLNETPKERLQRVAALARPFRREMRPLTYLIAAGLLLLIVVMVIVGIVGGWLGSNVFTEHARRILEWTWPAGR